MPRFVLLRHECPPGFVRASHWDLMLESEDALKTWACDQVLNAQRPSTTRAERLADHRLAYLEYEGPISGGRGSVTREDGGSYERLDIPVDDTLSVRLTGTKLQGTLLLRAPIDKGCYWRLEWFPDESSAARRASSGGPSATD